MLYMQMFHEHCAVCDKHFFKDHYRTGIFELEFSELQTS